MTFKKFPVNRTTRDSKRLDKIKVIDNKRLVDPIINLFHPDEYHDFMGIIADRFVFDITPSE